MQITMEPRLWNGTRGQLADDTWDVDFSTLDPDKLDLEEPMAGWWILKLCTTDGREVIPCRSTNGDWFNQTTVKRGVDIYVSDETTGKRLKNTIKHAIKLKGGKASIPPKPDPFDK